MKVYAARGDPRTLQLLDVNARYMRHETYQQLVANIAADGVLQQWPFVVNDGSERVVLSGNHRVRAAIDAGLEQIDWTETDEPLSTDRRISVQLSHNAIVGEDDPAVLRRLYESIESVDERLYAGLDDATLGLLAKIDLDSLGEANLDYATVLLVLLPDEKAKAEAAFGDAATIASTREFWLARREQHHTVLDALARAQTAYRVGNVATALDVVLAVFDRHADEDLRRGWFDAKTGEARHDGWVETRTLLGEKAPADALAVIARAVGLLVDLEDASQGWQALERICADWLAGADVVGH